MSKYIVVVKVSAGNDNNGIPRRLYIVKELDTESGTHHAARRLAIIEEGYKGWGAVSEHYPTAMLIEDIYITPQEYRRWLRVMKSDQKLRDQEALEKYEEERTNQ